MPDKVWLSGSFKCWSVGRANKLLVSLCGFVGYLEAKNSAVEMPSSQCQRWSIEVPSSLACGTADSIQDISPPAPLCFLWQIFLSHLASIFLLLLLHQSIILPTLPLDAPAPAWDWASPPHVNLSPRNWQWFYIPPASVQRYQTTDFGRCPGKGKGRPNVDQILMLL